MQNIGERFEENWTILSANFKHISKRFHHADHNRLYIVPLSLCRITLAWCIIKARGYLNNNANNIQLLFLLAKQFITRGLTTSELTIVV